MINRLNKNVKVDAAISSKLSRASGKGLIEGTVLFKINLSLKVQRDRCFPEIIYLTVKIIGSV